MGRKVNEWYDDCGAVLARAFSCEDTHWIEWRGLGVFAFSGGSHAVRVWRERNSSREAIADAFSRMLQPIILQALGWQVLHAGAAAGPAGMLAFCGRAGSGKSTLAFAMQQAGCQQFADDAVVLRSKRDCVTAYPLPFTPGLKPASRAHFDARRPWLTSPASQPVEVPLTAVFLLAQNAELAGPRISLLQQGPAFSELLTHAHCFDAEDPTHTRRLVDDYIEIVKRVPVFTLEYRPDFQNLGELTCAVVQAASSIDASGDYSSELQPALLFR
jgi:hypothetical protein